MFRISPFRESMGNTHRILCSTKNFMFLQVIRCRSTGECPRKHNNNNSPRHQNMTAEKGTSPSEVQGRIMFMRMFNDIEWWTNQNEPKCLQARLRSHFILENSSKVVGVLSDLVMKKVVRNQRQEAKGEMERHRTEKYTRGTSCIPML